MNNFKLRLVSKTSSFIAVDDISVQEVECRHNTFVIPDYRQKLASAQAQVDEVLASNPEADIYDTDLVPENTWWSPRMIAKSGHEFQVRVNFVGRNSYLGRDYSKYTSAYLFMVPGDTNNDDQLFWPWADQFFKLFVRDQNPNVVERMDQHVSYVTLAEDGDGNRDWEKPVDSPTGGYGRYSFITHFGKWRFWLYKTLKRELFIFTMLKVWARNRSYFQRGASLKSPELLNSCAVCWCLILCNLKM